jgi:hypothetical protein
MVVRIEIAENMVDKVMSFLQNLPKNEIKLDVEKESSIKHKPKKLRSISLKTKGFSFNREEANAR